MVSQPSGFKFRDYGGGYERAVADPELGKNGTELPVPFRRAVAIFGALGLGLRRGVAGGECLVVPWRDSGSVSCLVSKAPWVCVVLQS